MRLLPTTLFLALSVAGVTQYTSDVAAAGDVPAQTDDGLDPINLIWVGFAPAWWVVQNFHGWNLTPCSLPKTVESKGYDFTLENPNTLSQNPPCWGPRYHVRIWDMGYDPLLGWWSLGAVHHEYTHCTAVTLCHHVVDSWENAENLVRSTFLNETATLAVSNYTLGPPGFCQSVYNDGNATLLRLSRPNSYPITFTQTGLPEGNRWSITLNETTLSSVSNTIRFGEPNGTYQFAIDIVPGYLVSPPSGSLLVAGAPVKQSVIFTKEHLITFTSNGLPVDTPWLVTVNNTTKTSPGDSITFVMLPGAYSFRIGEIPGYISNPSSGIVAVDRDKTVAVTFTQTQNSSSGASSSELFLSNPLIWLGIGTLTGTLLVLRKKRSANALRHADH